MESGTLFLSRADADKVLAEQIGRTLENAGYTVILQQWDFANRSFIDSMNAALSSDARVVALLSADYLASEYCAAEWQSVLAGDPLNRAGRLVLLRVAECTPGGLLASLPYWDLVPLRESPQIMHDVVFRALSADRNSRAQSNSDLRAPRAIFDTDTIRPSASFTGRSEDLAAIDAGFERGAEVVALTGMGGVGKTTLAHEYAWRRREQHAVVWRLAAQTEDGIIADLLRLGAMLVRGFETIEDQRGAALQVRDHLLAAFTLPVLLVFDNLEDEVLLRTWRPLTGVRVLVTTRLRTWSSNVSSIELRVWSRTESLDFLRRESGRFDLDDGETDALADALGDLPLALAHAAAYLRATRTVSAQAYAARIARHLARAPRGAEYERGVFATFQTALAKAEEEAPGAAALLCFAAFFASDSIPSELVRSVCASDALRPMLQDQQAAELSAVAGDAILFDEALGALDRLSLTTHASPSQSFSVHRIVQAAARDLVGGDARRWIQAAVRTIESAFPEIELQNWPAYERLLPHALAAAAHAANVSLDDPALQRLLRACGAYLMERGRYAQARPLLQGAIDAYRAELDARSGERFPIEWATTQNDLGTALTLLGERAGETAHLEAAVTAYLAALEKRTRESDPLSWAQTQSSLGTALFRLGEREDSTSRLEEAVRAYRAALQERSREKVPLQWAETQNALGIALRALGEREGGTARLEEAVGAFRAALEERTRARVPLRWAETQSNLGNALFRLGERESGTARLEEAAVAYRAALEERTQERVPRRWADTQHNLAGVLWKLGEREVGTAHLEEAARANLAALEERRRELVPLHWAMTQSNLGVVLFSIGARERGTARLEEAIVALRAALEERTRERVPLDWAETLSNLGTALTMLGERESGTAQLEEGVHAYRASLEVRTRERVPLYWAQTQNNIGVALRMLGEREDSTSRLAEAVRACRAALEERTRERAPLDWAATQSCLGSALNALGEREGGTARLEEAACAFRASLGERTYELAPRDWAGTQGELASVLLNLGAREAATGLKRKACDHYREALDAARSLLNSQVDAEMERARTIVGSARKAFDELGCDADRVDCASVAGDALGAGVCVELRASQKADERNAERARKVDGETAGG